MSINMGLDQAARLLQSSLLALGHSLLRDGVFGPVTLSRANLEPSRLLYPQLRTHSAAFYRSLASSNPSKYSIYLKGWLARAAR